MSAVPVIAVCWVVALVPTIPLWFVVVDYGGDGGDGGDDDIGGDDGVGNGGVGGVGSGDGEDDLQ